MKIIYYTKKELEERITHKADCIICPYCKVFLHSSRLFKLVEKYGEITAECCGCIFPIGHNVGMGFEEAEAYEIENRSIGKGCYKGFKVKLMTPLDIIVNDF